MDANLLACSTDANLLSADMMSSDNDSQQSSQQPSQGRDAEGFATPVLPASTQKLFDAQLLKQRLK